MDLVHQQVFERVIDHALPRDAAGADKGGGHQLDREVAFSALRIISAMAAMLFAVVNDEQVRGIERQTQAGFDLCSHGAFCWSLFCMCVHRSYIGVLAITGQ